MPITLEVADKLIANGLQGISKQELSNILNSISYYRLRGYIYPYFHSYKNNKTIKNNITWETIWNDYNFDTELKGLLFQEIGKIKIALKTAIDNKSVTGILITYFTFPNKKITIEMNKYK